MIISKVLKCLHQAALSSSVVVVCLFIRFLSVDQSSRSGSG